LPLFKLLRKEAALEWTEECEQAFQHLKKALSEPPVLSRPNIEEVLYLYLAVASEAVSAGLIREITEGQKQVEEAKTLLPRSHDRIPNRPTHKVTAWTTDMADRMLKWSLEFSELDIRYESRKTLKAQVLADFVAEMTTPVSLNDGADKWTIFVDGASSPTRAGAGIILENENDILIE
ncbi:hypothetical protein A2U01_0039194, partial [Trifolium medium]|nr:hypothetical protein [Trifolium medium]